MDVKNPTSFKDQVDLLESRNCIIGDRTFCELALQRANYYHLSAYFLPFKQANGKYIEGTTFNKIYRIYEFDRKVRHLLFSALEEIELCLRTQVAYHHAHAFGPLGYLDEKNFNSKHQHEKFISQFNEEIRRNQKSLIVKHHVRNYDSKFPLWAAVEFFSFGMLSHFFDDLPSSVQKTVSVFFGYPPNILRSWFLCCTDLRNICAHYGRLYYRIFTATPITPKSLKKAHDNTFTLQTRLFDYMFIVSRLYPDGMKWNAEFLTQLEALFCEYADCVDFRHIGFTPDWARYMRR